MRVNLTLFYSKRTAVVNDNFPTEKDREVSDA